VCYNICDAVVVKLQETCETRLALSGQTEASWLKAYASTQLCKKSKASPYSIAGRRVPELIPVLGSQPAGDVSHKPGGRLPLLSTGPAVTPATLKTAATNFAA